MFLHSFVSGSASPVLLHVCYCMMGGEKNVPRAELRKKLMFLPEEQDTHTEDRHSLLLYSAFCVSSKALVVQRSLLHLPHVGFVQLS